MPKIAVEIEWDYPDEQQWLNADNIEVALGAYYKNTYFDVVEVIDGLQSRILMLGAGLSSIFDCGKHIDTGDRSPLFIAGLEFF